MSMFQICGVVVHLFNAPGRIDKESGVVDDDKPKVQIMGEVPQRNGQIRLDLVSLTCHNPADFSELLGQRVTVALGMFAPKAGQVLYFIPQGCKPSLAPQEAL
jgi:hypothetical protein